MKKAFIALIAGLVLFALYLMFWPVPVDPVVWQAPADPGYSGVFAPNDRLKNIQTVAVYPDHGPEDIALDAAGRIYTGTEEGNILRFSPDGTGAEVLVNTGGRPLGLEFDAKGDLIVADAYRGLLKIDPAGKMELLTDECDGLAIRFADDLDIARDGKIYFSDASRFAAEEYGGAGPTSILEIIEQRLTGRLLVYDPENKTTRTLLDGLSFANGVALGAREDFVLVNETGRYRIRRYWLKGPQAGTNDVFFKELPGFPDNIERGPDGLFWVALVSPRSPDLDGMDGSPFLRKLVFRLPKFLQPGPVEYLHVVALDETGTVRENLQFPETEFGGNTSVYATASALYLGSLHEERFAIFKR